MPRFATEEFRSVAIATFASLCTVALFIASVNANASGLAA